MKRYLHEKIRFVQEHRPEDEHVLVVPGAKDELTTAPRSRVYSIRSPQVSRTSQYRILLNLRAIDEIIEREQPDVIEVSDPYQLGWRAIHTGALHRIPVLAFYHSHFPEAYLRRPAERFGRAFSGAAMKLARAYVRHFYGRSAATLVASEGIREILQDWGVSNTELIGLGVNTDVFHPAEDSAATRHSLGIPLEAKLLIYVGRLTPEKNTVTLCHAFELLAQTDPAFHLLVFGDGPDRAALRELQRVTGRITWSSYSADPLDLAAAYRAADLFVHPGVEETFGLAALESQASGTPVVGIRGTFLDEVILHDQTDWARENSAAALADAIRHLFARSDLNELGRLASEKVVQRYAWPEVFQRLFSVYRRVDASYRRA